MPSSEPDLTEAQLRALPWDGIIPLAQVLTHTLPAYAATWDDALAAMYDDDSDTISTLERELSAGGGLFDEPVLIRFTEPDTWDEEDEADYGPRPIRPHVANGMHRIAAAVRGGAPTLRVTSTHPPTDRELIDVTARIAGPAHVNLFDATFTHLRSFRLNDATWVETSTLSGNNGVYNLLYECPHTLAGDLVSALVERGRRHQLHLDVIALAATTYDQLGIDDGTPLPLPTAHP